MLSPFSLFTPMTMEQVEAKAAEAKERKEADKRNMVEEVANICGTCVSVSKIISMLAISPICDSCEHEAGCDWLETKALDGSSIVITCTSCIDEEENFRQMKAEYEDGEDTDYDPFPDEAHVFLFSYFAIFLLRLFFGCWLGGCSGQ